jgi:hypothetical protein
MDCLDDVDHAPRTFSFFFPRALQAIHACRLLLQNMCPLRSAPSLAARENCLRAGQTTGTVSPSLQIFLVLNVAASVHLFNYDDPPADRLCPGLCRWWPYYLFRLSILSVFFDLVCDDVGAGPGKTCGKWCGVDRLPIRQVDLYRMVRLDLGRFGERNSKGSLRFRILRTWRRPLRFGGSEHSSRKEVLRNPSFRDIEGNESMPRIPPREIMR